MLARMWRRLTRYTGTVADGHGREWFYVRGRVAAVHLPERPPAGGRAPSRRPAAVVLVGPGGSDW